MQLHDYLIGGLVTYVFTTNFAGKHEVSNHLMSKRNLEMNVCN